MATFQSATKIILAGMPFAFTPTVDAAGDGTLLYSIVGLPPWATFNPTTGRLTGTPQAGDVGTYSNIRISIGDGTATASLASFSIQVVATASGSVTLNWLPPTENTDGSPLSDLVGYRIYWGTASHDYVASIAVENPGVSTYVIDQLTPATWYFSATAVNSLGVESVLSNEAWKTIR